MEYEGGDTDEASKHTTREMLSIIVLQCNNNNNNSTTSSTHHRRIGNIFKWPLFPEVENKWERGEMSGWCNRRSYKLVHSERVVGSQLRIRLLCFLLCHQRGFLSAQGSGIRWIQFFSCCVCFLAVSFVGWIGYLGLEVGSWLPTCMYTLVKRLNLNYIQLRLCVSIVTWEVRRRRINNSS